MEGRWAIVDTDSLMIFVRPQIYSGEAQSVATNFFTVYLQVKNKAGRTLSLNRGGFGIIVNQQQFDLLPLSVVLGRLQSGYSLSHHNDDQFFPQAPETQNQALEKAREQYSELVNRYFNFGDILPGGMKEGYLFYNEKIGRADSFELEAFGIRISFIIR